MKKLLPLFAIVVSSLLIQSFTKPPMLKIYIERKEILGQCMRGYLLTQAGSEQPKIACYVLEKPPVNNIPYVSAIPAGTYTVTVRTDGNLGWRLELQNVPNRDNVQIHIGNFPSQTVGCLLPGKDAVANQCAVKNSGDAMKELRVLFAVFGQNGITELTIRD